MKNEDQELLAQLQKLAQTLSMELTIPLLQSPINLNFATACVNAILSSLNPNWKQVIFQPKSQQQSEQCWRKLIKIVQMSFLEQDQKILDQDEEINVQNIVMLYEVLCEASQTLRQQNLSPVLDVANANKHKNSQKKKELKETAKIKQPKAQKNQPVPKNNVQNVRPKSRTQNKIQLDNVKRLEQQVIQSVTKTMQKKYLLKAKPKQQAKIRQKAGTQAVQKAKRTLDYALKQYQYQNKQSQVRKKKTKSVTKKGSVNDAYMKMIQNKHKNLNQQLQNQQLKYYIQLRDKKVAYIRHIHKLIEKLEKQRQIQYNKFQRQVQNEKKKQLITKIENVDNLFKFNMQKIEENYKNKKADQQLQNVGELEVCRAMEKVIKAKKAKQMEDMKNLWTQQRNQLHRITTDEQKMRSKLIQIYRQHRV